MPSKLKPLSRQVIVVTGALSPVGQETARLAARKGAAVILTAADEADLRRFADTLNTAGGRAHPVAADLGDPGGAARVARAGAARFGEIDTWINTGGEGGQAWVVNGAQAAARYFEGAKAPGVVVNIGAADAKSFSDELRTSLRKAKAPVSVSLVHRGATPRAMAKAALYAAQHPVRDLGVGRGGRKLTATETGLAVSLGALALAAAAAFLARGTIGARARPVLAWAARPAFARAAMRRPREALRLTARHPKAVGKVLRALR
jgi:hypothetical protein